MQRDIVYHAKVDRSHILPNLVAGAKAGIVSQFASDIIISLLLLNEGIILSDVEISNIASYYAGALSGIVASVLSIYLDPFAIVIFTTVSYRYTLELVNNDFDHTKITIRPREIIFDSILIIILMYLFDPTAHNQYLRYRQKRALIEPTYSRMDRDIGLTIFFIILINTYNFLKIVSENNSEEST